MKIKMIESISDKCYNHSIKFECLTESLASHRMVESFSNYEKLARYFMKLKTTYGDHKRIVEDENDIVLSSDEFNKMNDYDILTDIMNCGFIFEDEKFTYKKINTIYSNVPYTCMHVMLISERKIVVNHLESVLIQNDMIEVQLTGDERIDNILLAFKKIWKVDDWSSINLNFSSYLKSFHKIYSSLKEPFFPKAFLAIYVFK